MSRPFDGITTISFDADGTLWDFEKVMRHALGIALGRIHDRIPGSRAALTMAGMIEIRNRTAAELRGKVANLEAVRLEAFRRTLAFLGAPDDQLAEELSALYLKHRFEDIELYPDVLPALDALEKGHVLGLLSNGNSYPDRCGLGGRLRFVVFAQDHGFEKPDPRLFDAAIKLVGCRPDQLVHVGDRLDSDVLGAQRAGVRSVWLNRAGEPNTSDIRPDAEVASLHELVDQLVPSARFKLAL